MATTGVLPKVVADLWIHRDNGEKDESDQLSSGKRVKSQNLTIGGGSLSDHRRKAVIVPKGLVRTLCQILEVQGVIEESVANSLIEHRTPRADSTACCSALEITRTGRKFVNGVRPRCVYIRENGHGQRN